MVSKSFATTSHPRLSKPIGTRTMSLQTLDTAHGAARFDIYTDGLWSCFGLIFSCRFLIPHFWNVNAFSMPLYNGIMPLGFHFTGAPTKTALSLRSLNNVRTVEPSIRVPIYCPSTGEAKAQRRGIQGHSQKHSEL